CHVLRPRAAAGRRAYSRRGHRGAGGRPLHRDAHARATARRVCAGARLNAKTMDGARVSVIIPCYNLGEYLDEAVESVLAQTFQDLEIVVVDDGSTDERTRTLVADYRKPRTRVIRSENRGLPAAKNLGLSATSGPYVCMLDADDRLDSHLLEKSVAALDA